MKLSDLFEYSSANPFVGIVSAIDLRVREAGAAAHASSHTSIFISSLKSQVQTLLKFLQSGKDWNVPEQKLRSQLHAALPEIMKHVSAALVSIASGSIKSAHDHLMSARKTAVKRSHLTFGDIE